MAKGPRHYFETSSSRTNSMTDPSDVPGPAASPKRRTKPKRTPIGKGDMGSAWMEKVRNSGPRGK